MLISRQIWHLLLKVDQFAVSQVNCEHLLDFTDVVFALVKLEKGIGRHWAKSHIYQDYSLQLLRVQHKLHDL